MRLSRDMHSFLRASKLLPETPSRVVEETSDWFGNLEHVFQFRLICSKVTRLPLVYIPNHRLDDNLCGMTDDLMNCLLVSMLSLSSLFVLALLRTELSLRGGVKHKGQGEGTFCFSDPGTEMPASSGLQPVFLCFSSLEKQ